MLNAQGLQQTFLDVFADIDIHSKGVITHEDLRKYNENARLPDSFAEVLTFSPAEMSPHLRQC